MKNVELSMFNVQNMIRKSKYFVSFFTVLIIFLVSCSKKQGNIENLTKSQNVELSSGKGKRNIDTLEANQVKKIDLDGKYYLFRSGTTPATDLIITAHGGQTNFRKQRGIDELVPEGDYGDPDFFVVPMGGTTLLYYSLDGKTLTASIDDLLYGVKAKEIYESESKYSRDYFLTKYQTHSGGFETYETIVNDLNNYNKKRNDYLLLNGHDREQMKQYHRTHGYPNYDPERSFDILTIRRKHEILSGKEIEAQLSTLLRKLEKEGYHYSRIHCSFCRSA